ncbi:hypothetical protein K443DRAFT_687019, partial [Laccaria amethystina LaAM-08-1]
MKCRIGGGLLSLRRTVGGAARGEPDDTRASRPPQEFARAGQPSFASVLAAE